MFVIVRYGDDQKQIFNPNCLNTILLRYIKRRCCCDPQDTVELSDEKGVVKNLRQFPQEYAKAYVKDREVLILIKVENVEPCNGKTSVESNHGSSKTTYKPLLSSLVGNSDFMEALNPPREEDSVSDVSSSKSSRRRSSTFDMEELKANSARAKSKTSMQCATKKPVSKRGHRPPLRKTTTAS
ncbi:hypothetical protein ElyMa_004441600 [Elysia marginata]|uniref:Uncharacterized protein n=1 Tax=Elysia marginata TaxID=1093978 RepID=A0AAV4HDC0_9GAST|nr:hypothetical protein ElyMa_004441600 [Elysia marginata]